MDPITNKIQEYCKFGDNCYRPDCMFKHNVKTHKNIPCIHFQGRGCLKGDHCPYKHIIKNPLSNQETIMPQNTSNIPVSVDSAISNDHDSSVNRKISEKLEIPEFFTHNITEILERHESEAEVITKKIKYSHENENEEGEGEREGNSLIAEKKINETKNILLSEENFIQEEIVNSIEDHSKTLEVIDTESIIIDNAYNQIEKNEEKNIENKLIANEDKNLEINSNIDTEKQTPFVNLISGESIIHEEKITDAESLLNSINENQEQKTINITSSTSEILLVKDKPQDKLNENIAKNHEINEIKEPRPIQEAHLNKSLINEIENIGSPNSEKSQEEMTSVKQLEKIITQKPFISVPIQEKPAKIVPNEKVLNIAQPKKFPITEKSTRILTLEEIKAKKIMEARKKEEKKEPIQSDSVITPSKLKTPQIPTETAVQDNPINITKSPLLKTPRLENQQKIENESKIMPSASPTPSKNIVLPSKRIQPTILSTQVLKKILKQSEKKSPINLVVNAEE